LEEPGWDSLLDTHPGNSFFHTSAWARVLHETYGHQPVYFCHVSDGKLQGLLPIMEVSSRLIGIRAISLPFTDFCTPLSAAEDIGWNPYELALRHGEARGWRYLECRGNNRDWPGASPSLGFYGHSVALRQGTEVLFNRLKGAVRTGIRKAQASNLRIEFAHSLEAMRGFYALHCLTRRRHSLPPQPFRFFDSIARRVVACDKGVVASAFLGKKRIAAAVFFYHRQEALFKFGASDYSFQNVRPNNLVMWEAIKWCGNRGFALLHLGRTSLGNAGLRRFKLGFGAKEEQLGYCKYDLRARGFVTDFDRSTGSVNRVFRWLPVPVLRLSGKLLYPHLG
jgi:CelD/BcsL family acetyltransferase involved in cellulose biosynthesis